MDQKCNRRSGVVELFRNVSEACTRLVKKTYTRPYGVVVVFVGHEWGRFGYYNRSIGQESATFAFVTVSATALFIGVHNVTENSIGRPLSALEIGTVTSEKKICFKNPPSKIVSSHRSAGYESRTGTPGLIV